jgi:hypothetical protein
MLRPQPGIVPLAPNSKNVWSLYVWKACVFSDKPRTTRKNVLEMTPMSNEELEAYIRKECADADITVEEFVEIVKDMKPEEIWEAMEQVGPEVIAWARARA